MRVDQGIAVTNGWHNDASNIQQAMMILLESNSHDAAGGLQADALNRIRNVFQRLFRFHLLLFLEAEAPSDMNRYYT